MGKKTGRSRPSGKERRAEKGGANGEVPSNRTGASQGKGPFWKRITGSRAGQTGEDELSTVANKEVGRGGAILSGKSRKKSQKKKGKRTSKNSSRPQKN